MEYYYGRIQKVVLRKFLSDRANWEYENFDGKQKESKDSVYTSPVAVNA